MGFVVDKVVQGQIFHPLLPLFPACIIPPLPQIYGSAVTRRKRGAKLGNLPQKKERCLGTRVSLDGKVVSLGLSMLKIMPLFLQKVEVA